MILRLHRRLLRKLFEKIEYVLQSCPYMRHRKLFYPVGLYVFTKTHADGGTMYGYKSDTGVLWTG